MSSSVQFSKRKAFKASHLEGLSGSKQPIRIVQHKINQALRPQLSSSIRLKWALISFKPEPVKNEVFVSSRGKSQSKPSLRTSQLGQQKPKRKTTDKSPPVLSWLDSTMVLMQKWPTPLKVKRARETNKNTLLSQSLKQSEHKKRKGSSKRKESKGVDTFKLIESKIAALSKTVKKFDEGCSYTKEMLGTFDSEEEMAKQSSVIAIEKAYLKYKERKRMMFPR